MDKLNTIHGVFEEQVNHFPNQIAVLNGVQSLTYKDLNRKANQLAHHLRELGLTADTPVALCFERSVEFFIAIIAILKAGGAYLPLDPLQPEDRLSFLLNDSQAPILITNSLLQDKFSDYQKTLIFLDKNKNIDQQITDNLDPISTPEHLAYIIYTSGSTGTPKGVLIEHYSVINYCQWFSDYSGCKPQQRIDFSANPIFDMSVSTSIVPLMLGLTVVICDEVIKKNIRNYLNHLVNSRINIIKVTPSYFKVLLQETRNNFIALPQLSSIILGGENLSASECKSWLSFYPEHILFNEYGPTEATVAVSSFKVNAQNIDHMDASIPIGIPGTNMSCIVLGNNNLPCSDNEIGELFIGGVCLARGYLNQPELTQQQFIINNGTRLYKTGDLCKKHTNGIIEYLGRIDEQVKIRGFRIEPGEIEKQLLSHPAINEVAVLAQKDSFSEQRLVVYYILKDNDTLLNINQLREYLQKHLPDYMIPTVFVKVDCFPLTANGKLHKSALPIPLLTASHNYLEPKTALEKKLAEIWSEELGVQLIGIHDDFFDLGGHSLSAARIVSKINHELERTISLNDFYKATNIAQLVPMIKQTKKSKRKRTFRKSTHHKITKIPLSDFQFLLWMSNIFEPKAQKLNIVARKRFQGRLDKAALEFAFQAILKKHEALAYQILKFQPAQKVQKKSPPKLIIHDLQTSSIQQIEKTLQQSLAQLFSCYSWPKNAPLLIIKLFYLHEDVSELQICIPHLISDEYCMDIIFSELSLFYLNYKQLSINEIIMDSHFKEYIFNERLTLKMHLENDIHFWEEYLKDTSLFTFPEEFVVSNMKAQKLPYSTYSVIPEDVIDHFKYFCEQNHISINHGLSAAITLALRNCCGDTSETPYTYLNIIQSTRDNPIYDNTIGCFLRVEPTKVRLDDTATLISLSQQIRQSIIDTSNHQQCSNLVKLCAISSFKPNVIENYLINLITPLYTKLLKIPSLYRDILQRCGSRIISFKRNTKFFLNLNIRDNFIADSSKKQLFGLNIKQVKNNKEDLLALDYIFEASFFHDDNQNTHYLVISANLTPDFRERIAQEVFHIIRSLLTEKGSHRSNINNESTEQLL